MHKYGRSTVGEEYGSPFEVREGDTVHVGSVNSLLGTTSGIDRSKEGL